MAEATSKLEHWRLRLLQFELDTVHSAGKKHQTVDSISHLNNKGDDHTPLEDEVPVLTIFPKSLVYTP